MPILPHPMVAQAHTTAHAGDHNELGVGGQQDPQRHRWRLTTCLSRFTSPADVFHNRCSTHTARFTDMQDVSAENQSRIKREGWAMNRLQRYVAIAARRVRP